MAGTLLRWKPPMSLCLIFGSSFLSGMASEPSSSWMLSRASGASKLALTILANLQNRREFLMHNVHYDFYDNCSTAEDTYNASIKFPASPFRSFALAIRLCSNIPTLSTLPEAALHRDDKRR